MAAASASRSSRHVAKSLQATRLSIRRNSADLLWAVVVVAEQCDVDLEAAFTHTMDEIERSLSEIRGAPDATNPDITTRDEPLTSR